MVEFWLLAPINIKLPRFTLLLNPWLTNKSFSERLRRACAIAKPRPALKVRAVEERSHQPFKTFVSQSVLDLHQSVS